MNPEKRGAPAEGRTMSPVPTAALQVRQARINGVELAYVEEGVGETAVFVHGALGDWRTWEAVRPYVSPKVRYVALSRRYHCPNAWPDDGRNYSFAQHVEDLAEFIRFLNAGKVHLVGSSYSGRLVAHLALQSSELLRSVVIGEPSLLVPVSPEGKAAVAEMQKEQGKAWEAAKAGDEKGGAILLFNAVMGDPGAFSRISPARQQSWLDNAKTMNPMNRGAGAKPVSWDQLRTLKVPTLVMGGEISRAGFRLGNDLLMECLPEGTERAVISGAGHLFAPDNPKDTAQAILNFIAKH